ncbi:MAG TPA: hypothetical protein VLA34_09535, partial [Candidatus Krumholzibacterium sp.]|nr:hypothetical protein [Candidatus Krumholzibacterium sp.]
SAIREQALVIKTTRGSLLITGCAHPGIVGIVEKATDLSGRQVFFAMGGFHTMELGEERMAEILESFYELGVIYCGATHCTGDAELGSIKEAFGHRYVNTGAGAVIDTGEFEWRPSGASSAGTDTEAGNDPD